MPFNKNFRDKDYYYQELSAVKVGDIITLNEENTHHNAVVLRRKTGETIIIIDGKGCAVEGTITAISKRHCTIQVVSIDNQSQRPCTLHLGMGFTKNKSRYEWVLEKAVEIGVDHIIQIDTHHSEVQKINAQRIQNITSAAMIQSRTYHLPELSLAQNLQETIDQFKSTYPTGQIFIAHCADDLQKKSLINTLIPSKDTLILIGPEGDFSSAEIELCVNADAQAVALGSKRLRTETAALYAVTVFNALNYE